MGKRTKIISQQIDYLANKNGLLAAGFILFKSTLGVGLLLSPKYYAESGLLLSLIISFIIINLVTYGIYLVAKVSNQIEKDTDYKERVKNYDDLCYKVAGNKLKLICQVSNFSFNILIFIVNTLNGINYWEEISKEIGIFKDSNKYHEYFQLGFYAVYFIFIIIITEPEKLKITSFISGVIMVFLVILMWIFNIYFSFSQKTSYKFDYFNFSNFPAFTGNVLYALESVGTIFTVRIGMRNPKRLPNLIISVFAFCFFLFVIQGSTFLLAYGVDNIQHSSFDYFGKDYYSILVLKILFYLTIPLVMILYIITNEMMLYEMSFIKKRINHLKNDKKFRIITRLILLNIFYIPIIFMKDEGFIMLIGGCLLSPILGFIIPVY